MQLKPKPPRKNTNNNVVTRSISADLAWWQKIDQFSTEKGFVNRSDFIRSAVDYVIQCEGK